MLMIAPLSVSFNLDWILPNFVRIGSIVPTSNASQIDERPFTHTSARSHVVISDDGEFVGSQSYQVWLLVVKALRSSRGCGCDLYAFISFLIIVTPFHRLVFPPVLGNGNDFYRRES